MAAPDPPAVTPEPLCAACRGRGWYTARKGPVACSCPASVEPPQPAPRPELSAEQRYLVWSPIIQTYPGDPYVPGGPPEYGSCVVEIDAPSRRDAVAMACKTREFAAWVDQQAGDDRHPFAGVTARTHDEIEAEQTGET